MHAWISGRQLVAAVHDPTFPERHFARSRALGVSTIGGILIAPQFAQNGIWWTMPLLFLGLLLGLYPARRRIFDETWTLGTYLRYSVFSGVGMMGFWVLLATTPAVIAGLGEIDARLAIAAAALLAVMLMACQRDFPRFWLAMHRASPLERPDLSSRFAEILARASCAAPSVHRFGAPGGHVMNAIALAHPTRPAVAFGDAVLDRLEPREIAAIFAHEVAHLEHFDARRLRRLGMVSMLLVALATGCTAVLVLRAPEYAIWLSLGLMITIIGTLLAIASRSQANETASDLRAVELTGDPDALIDALTKLHLHLRMPRQWPHEAEAGISHPSLARRIKAIRERAHASAPNLRGATIARTPAATMRIALDDARAYWFEGLPADAPDDLATLRERASSYRALAYEELSELRLVPAGGGKALKARDLTGKAWMVSIRSEDVAPLHEALTIVDARLGQQRRRRATLAPRLLGAAMLLSLLIAGQAGVVLVPALVLLVRPALAPLAALGAMALARIAAAVASGDVTLFDRSAIVELVPMSILAAIAIVLAWRGWRASQAGALEDAGRASQGGRSATDASQGSRTLLLALAVSAVVVALAAVARAPGWRAADLLVGPATLSLAVLGTGIAAALFTTRSRWSRRSGGLLAIASLVLLAAGGRGVRTMLGPPLRVTESSADRMDVVALQGMAYRLELSPGARHFAVQGAVADGHEMSHDEETGTFRWTVGALDGPSRVMMASELAFIDADRMLILRPVGDSLVVSIEHVTPPSDQSPTSDSSWSQVMPALMLPELLVDVSEQRWTVVGRGETGELVAYSGRTDAPAEAIRRTWSSDSVWMQPLHVATDGSLIGYSMEGASGRPWGSLAMFAGPSLRFAVWRRAGGERVPLGLVHGAPECRTEQGGVLCAGRGVRRTQLWRWMPGTAGGPSAVLPAGFDVRSVGHGGPLVAVGRRGDHVLVIDPSSRTARRIAVGDGRPAAAGGPVVLDAKSRGDVLATLEAHAGGTRIGVYRVR